MPPAKKQSKRAVLIKTHHLASPLSSSTIVCKKILFETIRSIMPDPVITIIIGESMKNQEKEEVMSPKLENPLSRTDFLSITAVCCDGSLCCFMHSLHLLLFRLCIASLKILFPCLFQDQ